MFINYDKLFSHYIIYKEKEMVKKSKKVKRTLNLVLPENKDPETNRLIGILKAEETLYNFRKTGAGAGKLPKQELQLKKKKRTKAKTTKTTKRKTTKI